MSTGSHEVIEKINIAAVYGTLDQLDKHSNEHALQRASAQVTEPCTEGDNMIKTNILKLRRRWFTENHYLPCSLP